MRILQINSVYKVGSTGKIVADNADVLRGEGHEVFTCYGLGEDSLDEYSRKICNGAEHKVNALLARLSGIPFGGVYLSNAIFNRVVEEFQPDVVHVHCVNSFTINIYQLLNYLAKNEIKTVVTLHAEFFHTGGCGHAYDCEKWKNGCHHCSVYRRETTSWFFDRSKDAWLKMHDAFRCFKPKKIVITAVSPWLVERAKQSPILGRFEVDYVPNGVDTSIFHHIQDTHVVDRAAYTKLVLFVTPYFNLKENDLKGGRYIPVLAEMHPEYRFIVVAGWQDGGTVNLPKNIHVWGRAKTQNELAQLYSEADVTVLLSKRETFSMVTAESLCCGTPVVGFKAGGPESIALPEYATFVDYGDLQSLSLMLSKKASVDYNKNVISEKARLAYSKERMAFGYLEVYKKLK